VRPTSALTMVRSESGPELSGGGPRSTPLPAGPAGAGAAAPCPAPRVWRRLLPGGLREQGGGLPFACSRLPGSFEGDAPRSLSPCPPHPAPSCGRTRGFARRDPRRVVALALGAEVQPVSSLGAGAPRARPLGSLASFFCVFGRGKWRRGTGRSNF
jgi:hypothetical protein